MKQIIFVGFFLFSMSGSHATASSAELFQKEGLGAFQGQQDLLLLLLAAFGPEARTLLQGLSKAFRDVIDFVRKPAEEGGKGWTDHVQTSTEISVGSSPLRPVLHNGLIYVSNNGDGTVQVIDPQKSQVIATYEVGGEPRPAIVHEGLLYVLSLSEPKISVIDPSAKSPLSRSILPFGSSDQDASMYFIKNDSEDTIQVFHKGREWFSFQIDRQPHGFVTYGNWAYYAQPATGKISIIDVGGFVQ